MEQLTVVSSIFWPWILANLSIVSISGVCETFQIDAFNVYQREASVQFVEKSLIYLNLPTGLGISLIYQVLLLVWHETARITLLQLFLPW